MTASDHLSEGQFFHLTDDPKFHPDPERVPEDNSVTLSRMLGEPKKGLYVTKSPERWVNGYNYVRPFVAEIHANPEHVQHGEYGGEGFIPSEHLPHVKVHRVIPLDAHAREEYGSPGWVEEHHNTAFDTREKFPEHGLGSPMSAHYPYRGYRYAGPDVRQMSPQEVDWHKQRARDYLKENRGFTDEDLP